MLSRCRMEPLLQLVATPYQLLYNIFMGTEYVQFQTPVRKLLALHVNNCVQCSASSTLYDAESALTDSDSVNHWQ